jgi:pimeloyl-ACP methyl ester carboxylesterase
MADFGQVYADETLLTSTAAAVNAAVAASIASTPKDAYLQTVRSLYLQDTRSLVLRVEVPVLVLVGERDHRTPMPLAQELAQATPGAVLQVVPGAAHLANLDNPAGFHAAIDHFLETLDA